MRNIAHSPQPVGVTVVGILLLVMTLFNLMWILTIAASPVVRQTVVASYRSFPVLIFLTLVNAGLSLACGIGLLMGRGWARGLYIGFTPVLLLVSSFNGFPPTMIVGVVQYLIFLYVLTLPSSVEYFHGSSSGLHHTG